MEDDGSGFVLLTLACLGFILMNLSFISRRREHDVWVPAFAAGCGVFVVSAICYFV